MRGDNMAKNELYAVWFNKEYLKRYKILKIKTPFKDKVKSLMDAFLEQQEAFYKQGHRD